ncbi:hypothetical protein MUK72_19870 (plasmid) [Halococcus dombrowskii]|uniref:Uncharacterized protein n=1 Tax=Halococcus dombrowskii TaxID=179637 RepID=A0AAX3AVP0_HALDO|nr:hypothetical protein [Halococcus dombrowskii]UOO97595.1 hypothetical protein MUK72_19870 [Halococcus dombrowskii]
MDVETIRRWPDQQQLDESCLQLGIDWQHGPGFLLALVASFSYFPWPLPVCDAVVRYLGPLVEPAVNEDGVGPVAHPLVKDDVVIVDDRGEDGMVEIETPQVDVKSLTLSNSLLERQEP